jgi:hypothetical protein
MSSSHRDEERVAALLGALADGAERLPAAEQALVDELTEAPEAAAELDAHRALLRELRALPEPGPSPNWRMLEASIQRACAKVPTPRRWWTWSALRWPAFGASTVAMAGLALALWTRVPQPVTAGVDAAAAPAPTIPTVAVAPAAAPATDGALYLDDELLAREEIDEHQVGGLVEQIPAAAAITLGAADAEPDDSDELLPQPSFDHDLDQLDGDALRALDQWLDQPKQKG